MIQNITYTFPKNTQTAQDFFAQLTRLLACHPATAQITNGIAITPAKPVSALPATVFLLSPDVTFPQLHFGTDSVSSLQVGNVSIQPAGATKQPVKSTNTAEVVLRKDHLGSYYEQHVTPAITLYRLPIHELVSRLQPHIVRIDHTGFNIPSALIAKSDWKRFKTALASQTALYNYPSGQEWPFILPATPAEYATGITDFPIGREPKFELVYDDYSPVPTIQIDIETDLTRQEVEDLFPAPYGVSFPELADYFRTVYVHHEWPGLNIRFDIRFKNSNPGDDWQTGKWLVEDGGRITAPSAPR